MVPGQADGARSSGWWVPDTHEVDAWTLFCLFCSLHTLLSQWELFPCCSNGIFPMLSQWQLFPCCPNGNLSHVVPMAICPMLSQWHFFPCCPNGNCSHVVPMAFFPMLSQWEFPHGKFRSLSPLKAKYNRIALPNPN